MVGKILWIVVAAIFGPTFLIIIIDTIRKNGPLSDIVAPCFVVLLIVLLLVHEFTFEVTLLDGRITLQSFGRLHQIEYKDVTRWEFRAVVYHVDSRAGKTLDIPATIERPEEFEAMLQTIAPGEGSE
jgi:hypothetical protein